jgi:hypothetical protein
LLSPWDAKIQRAETLFAEFSSVVSDYFQLNPAQLEQIQTSKETIEAVLHIHQQPPIILASLSGEIIHNLRSALDSLVYKLVLQEYAKGGFELDDKCLRKIQFPIEKIKEDLRNVCFLKEIIGTKLFEDLQSFQPFVWGLGEEDETRRIKLNSGHHLAALQHLSNIDKHKGINFVFCKLQDFYISLPEGLTIKKDLVFEKDFISGKRLFTLEFHGDGDPSLISIVPRFGLSFEDNEYGFPGDSAINKLETFLKQSKFYVQQLSWHL